MRKWGWTFLGALMFSNLHAFAAKDFLDANLKKIESNKWTGIVYAWSPRLPFSAKGISHILKAGQKLKMPVLFLADGEAPSDEVAQFAKMYNVSARRMRSQILMSAGASLQYPSVFVFQNGRRMGTVIPGFKRSEIYVQMIQSELQNGPAVKVAKSDLELKKHEVTIVSRKQIPRMGYYFEPIDQTDLVAIGHFHNGWTNFIYSLKDGTETKAPGNIDAVVSPDGKFLVTDPPNKDMSVYAIADLLNNVEKPLVETPYSDDYQSMAVLADKPEYADYRVMSTYSGIVDYRFSKSTGVISEMVPDRRGCAGGLPRMSQDGSLSASFDSGETVIKLTEKVNGECQEVFRIPMATGKVSFDYSGNYLAFTIVQSVDGTNFAKTAIYNIAKKEVKVLEMDEFSTEMFHHFPKFMRDGKLMIHESATEVYDGKYSTVDHLVIVDPHLGEE